MTQSLQEWAGAGHEGKATLALVFTDIVGSTDLATSLGDKKWFDLVRNHFAKAREYKKKFKGYEIKLIGDAYMAAFKTADLAFQFAWNFYHDTGDKRIRVRIGINVGQVRVVENDLLGVMVNYTSRVQHELKGHGILLSDSAKMDVMGELGTEPQQFIFKEVQRNIKSFGNKKLWFVAQRGTPFQESTVGRGLRKYFLNETELIPPTPGSDKSSQK